MGKINLYGAFLFVLLCWMGMTSCYKEKKKDPVYIDALYRDHFYYKEGTYWIFYDSLTGGTDSLVTSFAEHVAPYSDPTDKQYGYLEKIHCGLKLYNIANDTFITSFYLEINAPTSSLFSYQQLLGGNPIFIHDDSLYKCAYLNTYTYNVNIFDSVYCITNYRMPVVDSKICLSFDQGFISIKYNYPSPALSLHLLRYNIKL